MDSVNDPKIKEVTWMSSSQVGKTEMLLNIIGYYMEYDASPMMLLQPTLQMAEAFSKDRVATMLRDTPAISSLVKDARARDSGNTLLHKTFPGGHITMAGANSPASLASRPIRIFMADEVDRYPISAGTEGDPIKLTAKRTTTFWNRKLFYVSTPTVKGESRIEMSYENSDQRHYHVPCPHCEEKAPLKWSQITWDKDNEGKHLPETAKYTCESCGALWDDHQKIQQMKKGGEWIAEKEFNGKAGFHLNELYSPWVKWSDTVADFLESKNDHELLKTWTNTALGETFDDDQGESIDPHVLYGRREEYAAQVPIRAVVLTMGVDTQDDRLELEVIGWNRSESWNVDYRILRGDPSQPQVWEELDEILESTYLHESGTMLHIAATCIDSGGHHTQMVYDYCKQRKHKRVFAIKGVGGAGRPIVSAPSAKQSGRSKRKVELYTVGVDDAKSNLYFRLNQTSAGTGYCHFPMERDEEYFEQLTSEKVVTKLKRGFPIREWVKERPRNEALDCRVYGTAAIHILNPLWSALEKRLMPEEEVKVIEQTQAEAVKSEINATRKVRRNRPKKSGFVRNW